MDQLDDFIRNINKHIANEKPLTEKFEVAELVQPNIVILLPAPIQKQNSN